MFINNAQSNTRFFLFDFVLILISCIALSLLPEFGWLFVIIASFPIAIRIIWNRSLYKSSYFNWLILLILITSIVGLFAAYDRDLAFQKFLLIIGSVLLYFSLSYQTKENLWIITIFLGIFGVITTFIFILTNNWELFPADFKFIETFGEWVLKLGLQVEYEPIYEIQKIQANSLAGINAIFLPLTIVTALHFWKAGNKFFFIINIFFCIYLSIGLVITSSRAALIALIFGLVLLAILNISKIRYLFSNNRFLVLIIPALAISIGVFAPIILTSINNNNLSISEITSFESRLQIARQTTYLIADFPFTGGGLGSFPGLYSQYILSIPFFMFGYSHNLYLDLMLEQGIFGFIFWILIIIASFEALRLIFNKKFNNGESALFATAIYSSLIILLIHGIIDDSIYSSAWGLPMLFILPGVTIALIDNDTVILRNSTSKVSFPIFVIFVLVTIALISFKNQIIAAWYANIGAINMAKIELAGWPTNEWNKPINLPVYNQAEDFFINSLSHQEDNVTANYRQGLVWMARLDFQKALPYLETAFTKQPNHRGVQKNIGYCYTWLGEFDKAELVLKQIPEAQNEMETYEWWWQTLGREDLSKKASLMAIQLSSD